MDYEKVCFVIMPFGKKIVGGREIDFDSIYDAVFLPAINAVDLPEGGRLDARRTDRDFFSGDISEEMFAYIEYSRFALADITGLNPNVLYELGVRHRAHEAGTAIFRQIDTLIPFDIGHIKAFPYEYEPEENIPKSKETITRVLTESLAQNRIDSPVRVHLQRQRRHGDIDAVLREAENAIRREPLPDLPRAVAKYKQAMVIDPGNPLLHQELGLLYKNQGRFAEALAHFTKATELSPDYSDAFRERGIVEGQIYKSAADKNGLPTGEDSLRKAAALNPEDFDAFASLGGILKREKKYQESLEMYRRASDVSGGHPYPLLNELKLYLLIGQSPVIDGRYNFYLKRVERILRAQIASIPPFEAPWSFFGLSEVCLFLGDGDGFLKYLDEGLLCINPPTLRWQAQTHRESLELLQRSKLALPDLAAGIEKLRESESFLPERGG